LIVLFSFKNKILSRVSLRKNKRSVDERFDIARSKISRRSWINPSLAHFDAICQRFSLDTDNQRIFYICEQNLRFCHLNVSFDREEFVVVTNAASEIHKFNYLKTKKNWQRIL